MANEILRPTSHTFSGAGTSDDPSYAYDASVFTYNRLGVGTNNADPTMAYHTWATPENSHTKRTLYIRRQGVGNSNDNWSIYYSTDGGSWWTAIETGLINPSAEWCPAVDISTDLDLSNLRVKVATAKVAAPDGGYAYIYDIMLECQLTGSTETLRPNAVGDATDLTASAGSNYTCVDEASADEDATYVDNTIKESTSLRDLYELPAHSEGSDTINSVKVYFRHRYVSDSVSVYAAAMLKTVSHESTPSFQACGASYATDSRTWANNPEDSQPWEWTDIDALQIGVWLYSEHTAHNARCTQVYVEVDYTAIDYDHEAAVDVGITASASRSLKLAREAQADIGIAPSADRQCVYHRYGWMP